MHNKTWKKEWDLLEEAYGSVNETTHRDDKSDALGPGEYVCPKTGNIMSKDGKVVHKSDSKPDVQEEAEQGVANAASEGMGLDNKELGIHADRPGADEELPEPGEVDQSPLEPEVETLIKLLLTPPSEEELRERAHEGRLSEYVDTLVKAKEFAQSALDFRKPKEIES